MGDAHAWAVVRPNGAPFLGAHLGHVGWAYELPDGRVRAGATENTGGEPLVLPPSVPILGGDAESWAYVYPDIHAAVQEFITLGYRAIKRLDAPHPAPAAAARAVRKVQSAGFTAVGNNCLNHTVEVLKAFGAAGLADPDRYPTPNGWFAAVAAPSHRIGR